jgi:hypothetical protein
LVGKQVLGNLGRIRSHAAKFWHSKDAILLAYAVGPVQGRPLGCELYCERDQRHWGSKQKYEAATQDQVKQTLHDATPIAGGVKSTATPERNSNAAAYGDENIQAVAYPENARWRALRSAVNPGI